MLLPTHPSAQKRFRFTTPPLFFYAPNDFIFSIYVLLFRVYLNEWILVLWIFGLFSPRMCVNAAHHNPDAKCATKRRQRKIKINGIVLYVGLIISAQQVCWNTMGDTTRQWMLSATTDTKAPGHSVLTMISLNWMRVREKHRAQCTCILFCSYSFITLHVGNSAKTKRLSCTNWTRVNIYPNVCSEFGLLCSRNFQRHIFWLSASQIFLLLVSGTLSVFLRTKDMKTRFLVHFKIHRKIQAYVDIRDSE